MYNSFKRESVYLLRSFARPPKCNGSNRHNALREFKNINNFICSICCCSKVAYTQPLCFGCYAECLGGNKGIDGCCYKRQEVIISRHCLSLPAPGIKAVKVCAECQNNRRILYHGLVEMAGCQFFLYLIVPVYYYAVNLHVACCGCPGGSL